MAKYNIKNYAMALAGTKSDNKDAAQRFLELLRKHGQFKNAKKIVELAQKYYLEKRGNKKITLETARKTELKTILKSLQKEGDMVEEKISPELVAGVKVVINDEKQLDFSLKNKLDNIF